MDLSTADMWLHKPHPISSCMQAAQLSSWRKNENMVEETSLILELLPGYGFDKNTRTLSSQSDFNLSSQDDGCRLALGLGPTPSTYCSGDPPVLARPKDPASSQMPLYGADSVILRLGLAGEFDGLQQMPSESTGKSPPLTFDDESSNSARESSGYLPSLLFPPVHVYPSTSKVGQETQFGLSPEPSGTSDCSLNTNSSLSRSSRRHHHLPKKCRFDGCSKGARGASGLCIAHGGGQRCQKPDCNKGAESRTAFCKAHGGGRRCHHLGCTKSAEGRTDYCIAHGGGRRCGHLSCGKAARGKSGMCIRHGGGKRCTVAECSRSAEGQAGLCISHGGGRRCQFSGGCSKGAQGSTMFCKAHGGGRRCVFEGCSKGAEGSTPFCKGHGGGRRCLHDGGGICPKSVHGGTDYCVAHGGGKRCVVAGCTRSARGRTDRCVGHGGGKRCQYEGCGKSAQGSTNYCKAHGGGKRCSWNGGCEKFARGRSGLCAAHGNAAAAAASTSGGRLFEGLVYATDSLPGIVSAAITVDSLSGGSAISDCSTSEAVSESMGMTVEYSGSMREGLPDMRLGWAQLESRQEIPEGRVHGGGLMSLLGGSFRNAAGFSGRF
ncbi:hypothetical protein KSP40_PGU009318 [Platanthera guangdongensis]|uniref:WRKY19-like zinc finger domain-containing protein n=1 Tax=Platanthera guangdongensis TaxID=2320717 RepID=A0ABR2LI45_9ASPA